MPRKKLEDAESKLLAAGLTLFARHGTERVNTNSIAKRAGFGIGTFYAYFSDKHALLREIESRTLAGIRSRRISALREGGSNPADQVRRSIAGVIDFAEGHREAYRVTFGRERAGATQRGPIVTESSRPTAEALRRLQKAGVVAAELDADLAARAYLSMEVGTLLWWLEDPSRARAEDLVDTLARMHPVAIRPPADLGTGSEQPAHARHSL